MVVGDVTTSTDVLVMARAPARTSPRFALHRFRLMSRLLTRRVWSRLSQSWLFPSKALIHGSKLASETGQADKLCQTKRLSQRLTHMRKPVVVNELSTGTNN